MEKNLTFGEFEELLNKWIVETLDFNDDFIRQSDALKQHSFKTRNNFEKVRGAFLKYNHSLYVTIILQLHDIHYKLDILKTLYQMLEENLKISMYAYNDIENAVNELESKVDYIYNNVSKDSARNNM